MKHRKQPLLILGTRSLAIEIADVVSETAGFKVSGFVENMERRLCSEKLEGLPIYWIDELAALSKTHMAICALATTHRSRFIEQAAACNIPFATVVHPLARISSKSSLGEGAILNPGVVIASHTKLGRHVLVNRGALIGHHTIIGDYVTIQPGANIAGACTIGNRAYVGMGAVIIDHLSIGSNSVIAAGAVVVKDVPDKVMVAGVPAKIIKENIDGI